eukprot:2488745-Prorocentrum_lima.AAC.1
MCVNCVNPEGHNCAEFAKHVLCQKEQQEQMETMRRHGIAAMDEVAMMKQNMVQAEVERKKMVMFVEQAELKLSLIHI